MFSKKILEYYKILKDKKIDNMLISVGILGVLIGFVSIPIIKEISVWPILIGVCLKLYNYTEEIERNIVPYDFNKLLPPPPKKKSK